VVELDRQEQQLGFREFRVAGTRLQLNGQDVVLRGVCRHDMWGEEQGHTLTHEQIEHDLSLIKELGANYVRLVHYPHDAYVVEVADRLGLMVSGEPLSWQSDFADERIASGALECLRRLILRDRSHAAVIFWLCWNECQFRGSYLRRARALCRELDPQRPVSAASHVAPAATKAEFDRVGMDFYTFHPYGIWPDRVTSGIAIEQAVQVLAGKPVVFTEWGGWPVQENYMTMAEFGRTFIKLARQRWPEANLAGFSFWEWADMPEPVREPPACHNGVLNEGLVSINREKRPMYPALAAVFSQLAQRSSIEAPARLSEYPINLDPALRYVPLDLTELHARAEQQTLWNLALDRMLEVRRPLVQSICGPALPHDLDSLGGLPVMLPAGPPLLLGEALGSLEVEVEREVAALVLLGEVSLVGGWPLTGGLGEPAARYVLHYADGTKQEKVLYNGYEMASAGTIFLHSRIDPRAAGAPRALLMQMDSDWKEAYQVNCMVLPVKQGVSLLKISFELLNSAYLPALYGISLGLAVDK
ncbi:MAG: glycoside hydrolase family 2 TIM barrel-domain containing protein, partial [Anaerolineae bacterium]